MWKGRADERSGRAGEAAAAGNKGAKSQHCMQGTRMEALKFKALLIAVVTVRIAAVGLTITQIVHLPRESGPFLALWVQFLERCRIEISRVSGNLWRRII